MTATFGVLHVPTANFLNWFNSDEEAKAWVGAWVEQEEDFEIVKFDSEGTPVWDA